MKFKTGCLFVSMCSGTKQVLLSEKILLEFSSERDLLEQICSFIGVIRAQVVEPMDSRWFFDYEGDFKSVVEVFFRLSPSVDGYLDGGVDRALLFESSNHEVKKLLRGLK